MPNIQSEFKIGLIEKDMGPLKPGELFLPYLPRINGPRKSGLLFDQMLAYASLRHRYHKQDLLISHELKSINAEETYLLQVGNKIMKRIMTRSITEKIEDDIEMIMNRILGVDYVAYIKHPERFIPFIDFHYPTSHFYRGGVLKC